MNIITGKFQLHDAIASLVGSASFTLVGDVYEGLDWHDKTIPKPTKKQVEDELKKMQSEYDKNVYQRLREAEYPPLPVQLDMQYHDSINGTTVWQDTIQAIKDKYPKS